MENASKALIVAGAILIAILLITIGIILINSSRSVVDSGTTAMSSQAIQAFNAQFTQYEGKNKSRQTVSALLNTIITSNASHSNQVAVRMILSYPDTQRGYYAGEISSTNSNRPFYIYGPQNNNIKFMNSRIYDNMTSIISWFNSEPNVSSFDITLYYNNSPKNAQTYNNLKPIERLRYAYKY